MIYIFKGCKSCCNCPAATCNAVAEAVEDCTKGCCDPCAECCAVTTTAVTQTWDRPLGCYVVFTIISSLFMWGFCITAISVEQKELLTPEPTVAPSDKIIEDSGATPRLLEDICEKSGLVVGMIVLDAFIFMLNTCFAIYVQNKIWAGLVDLVDDEELEAQTKPTIRRRNVAQLIKDSSTKVCLYDFCFCFYFFFLIAQFAVNMYMGTQVVHLPHCDRLGWSSWVAWTGTSYPALVVFWIFAWLCFLQMHSACETCCKPFGGFSCCFGKRPGPRGGSYYDGDELSDMDEPVQGVLINPANQMQMQPMQVTPAGAPPQKPKKKKGPFGSCVIS